MKRTPHTPHTPNPSGARATLDPKMSSVAESRRDRNTAASPSGEGEGYPEQTPPRRVPLPLRVFGALNVLIGILLVPPFSLFIVTRILNLRNGAYTESSIVSIVVLGVATLTAFALVVMFAILGVRLLRNKPRHAARIATSMIAVAFIELLCSILLAGLTLTTLFLVGTIAFLVVLAGYADPALAQERELQRKLRDMDLRDAVEKGTAGRDETGRGYIALNFFNLFWIFVICCILGLIIETVDHAIVFGGYEDRAGLLYGPFSPIYGVGGALITIALNRFYRANFAIVYVVSALIGGAFEYVASWFFEHAFGVLAWDYSGTFLNFNGRTNLMFMLMWGALGLVWVKAVLPRMLEAVNLIPWNWRYGLTTACAALMFANCALTLVALDCWYGRVAGTNTSTSATVVEQFCNEYYDNAFMQHRFQTMSIDPERADRSA